MWISKNLARSPKSSGGMQTATMSQDTMVGDYEARNFLFLAPYGVYAYPEEGTQLLTCADTGTDICMGAVTPRPPSLKSGELLLKNKADAFIHLREDGCISLNGLVISPGGMIIEGGIL